MDRFSEFIKMIQRRLRGRYMAYIISLILPVFLTLLKVLISDGESYHLWNFVFILNLIFNMAYYLLYQKEMIYLSNSNSRVRFSVSFRLVLNYLFFILMFGIYFNCLEILNPGTFKIQGEGPRILDYIFYSSGVFLMNSQIEIQFSSILAYLIVFLEQVASFLSLVFILGIFKRND